MKKYWIYITIGIVFLGISVYISPTFFGAKIAGEVGITKYHKAIGKFKDSLRQEAILPKGDIFTELLPAAIKLSIGVLASVMLIYITLSGIWLVTSGIDESNLESAKKIFTYIIIGALIVTLSLSLVYAITQIDWTA